MTFLRFVVLPDLLRIILDHYVWIDVGSMMQAYMSGEAPYFV